MAEMINRVSVAIACTVHPVYYRFRKCKSRWGQIGRLSFPVAVIAGNDDIPYWSGLPWQYQAR